MHGFLRWLKEGGAPPGVWIAFAHPDDETIGAGAVLARLDRVRLLCATDGAPFDRRWWGDHSCASRDAYAELRRRELEAAISVPKVPADALIQLPLPDQTLWQDMAGLSRTVARLLASDPPDAVLTHPYEGGHPDHDSIAFAVHAACALLRRDAGDAPELIEFASYHAHGEGLATGGFLPDAKCAVFTLSLSPEEQALKRRMLDAHASQRQVLAQFGVEEERFRPAPAYDFTTPPHPGPLWYERFDWGCTGAAWRASAAEALRELGLAGSPRDPGE